MYALDRLRLGSMGNREAPILRNLTELAWCRVRRYDGVWTPAMNRPDRNGSWPSRAVRTWRIGQVASQREVDGVELNCLSSPLSKRPANSRRNVADSRASLNIGRGRTLPARREASACSSSSQDRTIKQLSNSVSAYFSRAPPSLAANSLSTPRPTVVTLAYRSSRCSSVSRVYSPPRTPATCSAMGRYGGVVISFG